MAESDVTKLGRCLCGGRFELRNVEIKSSGADLIDVPEGVCSSCGRKIYKAQILYRVAQVMGQAERDAEMHLLCCG